MDLQDVLDLIQAEIIANGNNEITADVLRPILEAILQQPNDLIGLLADLDTTDNTDLVAAINSIVSQNLPNATALRPIDTTGVDFDQDELLWVRDAINNTIVNNGNFTCVLGQQIVFYLDALISNDGSEAVVQRRYYRLTTGATTVTGLTTGLNPPLMQDGADNKIIDLSSDIVIDLGDIGTDDIEDAFNSDSNQPFTISGDTFVQAVQDSENKLWQWIGGDGIFGDSATLAESTFFVDLTDGDVPIDIGTQDLEDVISQDPVATSSPTFEGGMTIGNGNNTVVWFTFGVDFINYDTVSGFQWYSPNEISLISGFNEKNTTEITTLKGDWNASTNSPALSDSDTDKKGYVYKVSDSGTVDFGAGNITFAVGDYLINDGTSWEKYINNNQGGGGTSVSENVLAKANSIGELVDSDVFDDGSGVGIGTTSPREALDVAGNIIADGDLLFDSDSYGKGVKQIYSDDYIISSIEFNQDEGILKSVKTYDNLIDLNLLKESRVSTNVDGSSVFYKDYVNDYVSEITITETGVLVRATKSDSKGLFGQIYYGANYTDNTYVQKKYVDDVITRVGFAAKDSNTTVPATTFTVPSFNIEIEDTNSAWDGSKFTVPTGEGGMYDIQGHATFASVSDGNNAIVGVYVNGSLPDGGLLGRGTAGATGLGGYGGGMKLYLDAGDEVEMVVFCENSTNLFNNSGNEGYSTFSVYKMI